MTTLDYRFQVRGGLAAALASLNEVPLRREMIVELDNLFTTGEYKAKIGDGTTHYNDLPYLQVGSTGGAGLTAYAGNPLNAGSGTITVPSQASAYMQVTVGGVDYLIPAYALLSGNPGTWAAYVNNIGPYAWWRMDEAVGATALTDQVGASTATLAGSYTLHSPGLLNDGDTDTAVLFTNGSAISAANAKWAIGTGDVSILCIAKFTGTTFQSIASIRDGSGTNIMGLFGINSSVGQVQCQAWDGIATTVFTTAGVVEYNDGNPHVLGMTTKLSTKELSLYVDGTKIGTKVMTNSRPSATTMRVNLGLNYSDQNFSGTLDEFVVFNKLLTDTQMSDLADLALNGRTP